MKFIAALALMFVLSCGTGQDEEKEKSAETPAAPAVKEDQKTPAAKGETSTPEAAPQPSAADEGPAEAETPVPQTPAAPEQEQSSPETAAPQPPVSAPAQNVEEASPPPAEAAPPSPKAQILHNQPRVLNFIGGVYIGRGDVSYSWYSFLNSDAYLKVNVAYSAQRDELLFHVGDQDTGESLCSVFSGIKFIRSPNVHEWMIGLGDREHSGAVKDAVQVTQFALKYNVYDENMNITDEIHKPDAIAIYIGENDNDRVLINSLKKTERSPEKSFEALKAECSPSN